MVRRAMRLSGQQIILPRRRQRTNYQVLLQLRNLSIHYDPSRNERSRPLDKVGHLDLKPPVR